MSLPSKIEKALLFILFGKDGIDGYYVPNLNEKKEIILGSVFPDKETQDRILNKRM